MPINQTGAVSTRGRINASGDGKTIAKSAVKMFARTTCPPATPAVPVNFPARIASAQWTMPAGITRYSSAKSAIIIEISVSPVHNQIAVARRH